MTALFAMKIENFCQIQSNASLKMCSVYFDNLYCLYNKKNDPLHPERNIFPFDMFLAWILYWWGVRFTKLFFILLKHVSIQILILISCDSPQDKFYFLIIRSIIIYLFTKNSKKYLSFLRINIWVPKIMILQENASKYEY